MWAVSVALAAGGAVALLLASVGAWFVVGRALAPIGRIAETAKAMSESRLGLAICEWIAESHGGQIRCESAGGRGARFTVEFPLEHGVEDGPGVPNALSGSAVAAGGLNR